MRKKVWLARSSDGLYKVFTGARPSLSCDTYYNLRRSCVPVITSSLCEDLVKEWFDLKKHLKKKTCVQGYFSVSFKPIKKAKKVRNK